MNSVDAYFFSLLLISLAAYIADRYRFGFLLSGILIILALGIYQAYYSFAVGLMIGILIIEILRDDSTVKQLLEKALKFASSLTLGMILYYAIVSITTRNTGLTSYMGIDDMGKLSASQLPSLVFQAYSGALDFFLFNSYSVHFPIMRYAFTVLGAALLSFIVLTVV
jgi:hypothetical protein